MLKIQTNKAIIPATLTLLDREENFCPSAQSALTELLLSQGADGFYVGGSTGGSPLLPMDTRKALIEETMACVQGRVPVIACTGFVDTKQTIELSRFAAACGADAVSSVAPYYYGFTGEEVYGFYSDMAQNSPVPVLVYYLQSVSGNMGVDLMARILESPNVCGIKYTAPSQYVMMQLKAMFPEKLVYSECDEQLFNGLFCGADGGIGTTYNALCDLDKAIIRAYEAEDVRKAQQLSHLANRFIATARRSGSFMSVYTSLLRCQGIEAHTARRPFKTLSDDQYKQMLHALAPLTSEPGAEYCAVLQKIRETAK